MICAGGGGIPTMYEPEPTASSIGVEAVIDKDLCSELLARELDADLLVMATDAEAVFIGWGTPEAKAIHKASPAAMGSYSFPAGSMGPKVEAACRFAMTTGHTAAIGALADMPAIVRGEKGTLINKKFRGHSMAQVGFPCRPWNGRNEEERWLFDPFVPDVVTLKGSKFTEDAAGVAWESLPTDVIKREQQCWNFHPKGTWHGYAGYADGYVMVDPNKLMLLTPGINRKTGEYLGFGVPATVVANYLWEQRVVPEKCDLNSILFLITPAEDESKLNTLIAKLVKFKNLWDRDATLRRGAADALCGAQ